MTTAPTTPPIDRLLPLLRGVTKTPNGWDAVCPAHDDTKPSLGVRVGQDGTILLRCRSQGCKANAIVEAIGLTLRDLFPGGGPDGHAGKPKLGPIVATYDYRDEGDRLLYQVTRHNPKDFRQRKPDGNGGWTWKLNGVPRVPYRLPHLLRADPAQWLFVVEGEKDADTLALFGLSVTTCAEGAGKWATLDAQAVCRAFGGRKVVVIPDNDNPGRDHARDVAERLSRVAAEVRIIELPGLAPKGDVSDWLAAGGTVEELRRLVEAAAAVERPATVPAPPEKPPVHLTDLGNARRVIGRHGADLRFVHPWKLWLVWDGRRWREDATAEAVRRVKETQGALYAEAVQKLQELQGSPDDDVRAQAERGRAKKILDHVLKWEDARAIVRALELAKSEPGVPLLPEDLDRDRLLLNVLNGTIDLRTGRLRPHNREDAVTKLAPVEFRPDAACPLWERFLDRVMGGSPALVGYLQRVVGYGLTGDVSEQALWFLYGTGANGKSTCLSTLLAMMGDYGMQAVSELLMVKHNESHPTERADLFGKRFVTTIETESGQRMAEALMKQMTGGDRIRARKMHRDFFEFDPTHKIILAANHKPVVRGTDHAAWRRIKLVPFTVTIPDAEKDTKLPDKLRAELPGILAWAVRGCLEWQRTGLGEPEEVKQATDAYRAEQDTIAAFVEERCFVHPSAKAKPSDLHNAYCSWSGDKLLTQRAFGDRLELLGYQRDRSKTGRFHCGIGLHNNRPEDAGDAW